MILIKNRFYRIIGLRFGGLRILFPFKTWTWWQSSVTGWSFGPLKYWYEL